VGAFSVDADIADSYKGIVACALRVDRRTSHNSVITDLRFVRPFVYDVAAGLLLPLTFAV
jgi:hypothetical protein